MGSSFLVICGRNSMSKEFQQHCDNACMHGAGSNFIGIKERQLAVGVVSYMCQKLGDPCE